MSRQLENARVLQKLCDNISHTISALHATGMIAPHTKWLIVEVADALKHQFSVKWGIDGPIQNSYCRDAKRFKIDEYEIGIIGGGDQSEAIAILVRETINSSINMLDEVPAEVLW